MDYRDSVRYLLSLGRELAAPTQAAAAKFDLENIAILAERLGHPERIYPSVHIAGTNGKGSTAAFLESILRSAGYRTGLYTSPHLERINERIRVNGDEIADEVFAAHFTRIQKVIEALLAQNRLRAHPTFFECITALAFDSFAKAGVEFAVFEVGLGGRLDATNILQPKVSVITRIDFDHENFLGHSLQEIAREKAGIIKGGVPVVLAEQRPEALEVVRRRAAESYAPVIETATAYDLKVFDESTETGCVRASVREIASGWQTTAAPQLPGHFQAQNTLNAIAAARVLQDGSFRISDEAIKTGIANARWPGRLEKLQSRPDVYLDGAHNPAAARELRAFLDRHFSGRKIWMVFGALRDKAVDEIAGAVFPAVSEVVFTEPRTARAISATQLAEIASHHASHFSIDPVAESAFDEILTRANPTDAIFVTGSLYLVGQIRHYWRVRTKVAAK